MPNHSSLRRGFIFPLLIMLLGSVACSQGQNSPSFSEARREFHTKLLRNNRIGEGAENPPAGILSLVAYPAPLGEYRAYVSPRPAKPGKRPAIIWLVGGFSNSIGDIAWTPGPKANDQSAAVFRDHAIVMMYPSLRGGNDNPGSIETFAGEVDDVIAATKYLASLDYVDPTRIYLGGHSTGGTLALLVAAAAGKEFRAVFALGPVDDVVGYGSEVLPFDVSDAREAEMRAPKHWLKDIACPTFVFEGTAQPSNIASLRALERVSGNPMVHFLPVSGGTHFSIIAPLVERLASSITADPTEAPAFELTPVESHK